MVLLLDHLEFKKGLKILDVFSFDSLMIDTWQVSRSNAFCAPAVTMQAHTVAPPDLQCKDKFLVQSVVVGDGLSAKDITSQMVLLVCNV